MAQETPRERHTRLEEEHSKAVASFVYGEAPLPLSNYRVEHGRKVYETFEDYLNG